MTPFEEWCKENGYDPKGLFVLTMNGIISWRKGDVVRLMEDDGSDVPFFELLVNRNQAKRAAIPLECLTPLDPPKKEPKMTESIEITAENWMQFWGQEVEVSDGGGEWFTVVLSGYNTRWDVDFCFVDDAGAHWAYARTIATKPEPAEKVFLVSDDHREIFEALKNGALVGDEFRNYWNAAYIVDYCKILLTPDYTKPLKAQEWIRMELRK